MLCRSKDEEMLSLRLWRTAPLAEWRQVGLLRRRRGHGA